MNKNSSDCRDDEEPLTPVAGYFVRPEHNLVILCAIGFANPIDIDAIKDDIAKFVIAKVPRFSSLLVYDPFDGSLCWKQTHVEIDDHVIIHNDDDNMVSYDDIINTYMTSDIIMSSPLSLDKPLWELHMVPKHKFMIMKVHHALADGMSMMSLLWSMGRPKRVLLSNDDNNNVNNEKVMSKKSDIGKKSDNNKSILNKIWDFVEYIWYFFIYKWNFIARFLWEKDEIMEKINGNKGEGVLGRNMATASFRLDDMRAIKKAIPNATIHDVLYGTVWCGLTKYLHVRYPQALKHDTQITGLCPSNFRKQPGLQDFSKMDCERSETSFWGNKVGLILTPIFYYNGKQCDLNPLMYVKKAKSYMDRQKQYSNARIFNRLGCIMSTIFGSNKITSFLLYKLFENTTFVLSNIVGPPEEIFLAGNPVTLIRFTLFSPKNSGIYMHLVSYKGRADLQVHVPKDHVFSDPKFLAKCFQDSLLNMKSGFQDDVSIES